jgi:hypothetical protein
VMEMYLGSGSHSHSGVLDLEPCLLSCGFLFYKMREIIFIAYDLGESKRQSGQYCVQTHHLY